MRGLFIQKSLEFRLDVQGDSFEQGQAVACTLKIINRGTESTTLKSPTLRLAVGDVKLVKAKDPGAFTTLATAEIEQAVELASGAEFVAAHTFTLDRNCPITEKAKSPFLLYGDAACDADLGQLPLTVTAHTYLQAIFDTLTTVFSFIPKSQTSKGGWTTIKLRPPESRAMSFVDELNLSMRFTEDSLEVSFLFSVKKFDASQTKVGVRKDKTELKQSWAPQEYLFGGEFIRQEFVEAKLQEALAEVSSGL